MMPKKKKKSGTDPSKYRGKKIADFGKKTQVDWESVDKKHSTINWEAIREQRKQRILWEIEQGLNPPEANEVLDNT